MYTHMQDIECLLTGAHTHGAYMHITHAGYCGVCEHGVQWVSRQSESGHSIVLRHVCEKTSHEVHCTYMYMYIVHIEYTVLYMYMYN